MLVEADARPGPTGPSLVPTPYVVVERREEAADVVTLAIEPTEGPAPRFRHGQFNMVTSFGRERSRCRCPAPQGPPVRSSTPSAGCGAVTAALCARTGGFVRGHPRALRHIVGRRRGRRRCGRRGHGGWHRPGAVAGSRSGPRGAPAVRARACLRPGRRALAGPDPLRGGSPGLGAGRRPSWGSRSTWERRDGPAWSAW